MGMSTQDLIEKITKLRQDCLNRMNEPHMDVEGYNLLVGSVQGYEEVLSLLGVKVES